MRFYQNEKKYFAMIGGIFNVISLRADSMRCVLESAFFIRL